MNYSKHRILYNIMYTSLILNRFLYMTVVALDANFRLRRRAISNEERDPALSSGWAYFVEDGPYREYLKDRVDDDEVNRPPSCYHGIGRLNAILSDKYVYRVCSVDGCEQQVYERVCYLWRRNRYRCTPRFYTTARRWRSSKRGAVCDFFRLLR